MVYDKQCNSAWDFPYSKSDLRFRAARGSTSDPIHSTSVRYGNLYLRHGCGHLRFCAARGSTSELWSTDSGFGKWLKTDSLQ